MSESSDQALIDNRDDEALVFAKVGQAQLSSYEDQTRGNDVPLAAAAEYGILCLRDAEGIGRISLQFRYNRVACVDQSFATVIIAVRVAHITQHRSSLVSVSMYQGLSWYISKLGDGCRASCCQDA